VTAFEKGNIMPTDTQRNTEKNQHNFAFDPGIQQPDEFLSLREIGTMILRHRRVIVTVVLLATLGSAIFFIASPKQFEAEGYLQVIPTAAEENRTGKELLETLIASYLQRASSAYIIQNMSATLESKGLQISPLYLSKIIKISRPPKTDLIRIVAKATSPDEALLIVKQWIGEFLESIRYNNIQKSLITIRLLLNNSLSGLMEKQAAVENLRAQVSKTEPLITVSRAVDDRQLWSDLTQKPAMNPDALKKLSGIHIRGQEQSEEYINLTKELLNTEQELAAARSRRDLYQEVEQLLEFKTSAKDSYKNNKGVVEDKKFLSESERYVNVLVKRTDVIQFGEPGIIWKGRGALTLTSLVFLISLVMASFCAFIYERWNVRRKIEIQVSES
jgi:hypothetical protein